MNKTMIAVALLALASFVPKPTSANVEPVCTEDVEEFLTPFISGDPLRKNVCVEELPVVPAVGLCDKNEVGVTYGAREVCVAGDPGPINPELTPCEEGTGLVYGEREACYGGGGPELPDLGGKPPCPRSEDDGGFGGTHVTCYYHCAQGDELHISVTAEDTDAEVSGYTDCGGAHADCPRLDIHCEGVSVELTQNADFRGCVGDSHEFYSSKVTVTCTAIGLGVLCTIIECGLSATSSTRATCLDANPTISSSIVDGLLSQVGPGPVNSFVVMQFERVEGVLSGLAMTYDSSAGSCWVGPL